jgi:hypothetical protein
MAQRVYITDGDDIRLFKTRRGHTVHIQSGVKFIDLLGQEIAQDEKDDSSESPIGWMLYERYHAICGQISAAGTFDPDRGTVGWCEDTELCARCMSALDDNQRQLIFEELTSREVVWYGC